MLDANAAWHGGRCAGEVPGVVLSSSTFSAAAPAPPGALAAAAAGLIPQRAPVAPPAPTLLPETLIVGGGLLPRGGPAARTRRRQHGVHGAAAVPHVRRRLDGAASPDAGCDHYVLCSRGAAEWLAGRAVHAARRSDLQ